MLGLANLIAIAAFTLLIALELWLGRRRGVLGYTLGDSVASAVIGAGSLAFGTVTVLQGFAVHRGLDGHALFELDPGSPWTWILVTLLVDLAFYASHRAMHRINAFWTVHAVHHQSEQLNLLVALRIGWGSVFVSWIFYLPLALVDVTLEMTLVSRAASSLYQFWLHTQHVGKLGVLEYVLVTPSQHRVHHATNPDYLDKNYGGIFCVWDRLFGTFAEERDAPVYGTTRPLRSHNPFWANAVEWVRLAKTAAAAPRWSDKLQLWLRPPDWEPRRVTAVAANRLRHRYSAPGVAASGAHQVAHHAHGSPMPSTGRRRWLLRGRRDSV